MKSIFSKGVTGYSVYRHRMYTGSSHDSKLRENVKMVGAMLGEVIKNEDSQVYESVEKLRNWGKEWRQEDGDKNAFDKIVEEVKTYDARRLMGVSRAFTHFLALSNSCENHHRIRRLRERTLGINNAPNLPKVESTHNSLIKLKSEINVTGKEIIKALESQCVEVVLTAHPTEVNRRTMLKKHKNVKALLEQLDYTHINAYEKRQIEKKLTAEIASIWQSDELMRKKPTPVDEARAGLAVVETVLWKAVPNFLRKLDDSLMQELNEKLPLHCAPIKLASWMGGDRDGNPNVTPTITLEVSLLSRWMAATLLKTDIADLRSELSLRSGSKELMDATNNAYEPYREVLKILEIKLGSTIEWLNAKIAHKAPKSNSLPLVETSELMDPLLLLHRSLTETGNATIADGLLTDIIRRLAAFGLSLLPLDIRQESTRHSQALDAITKHLGVGSYLSWDEKSRREWLQNELASKRPMLSKNCNYRELGFSPAVIDTLETFDLLSLLGSESLGAYVISQCQQASDVLAVCLLQQEAGISPLLRVVPLFETLDDLERSAATVESLFSMPVYKELINGSQEIMVGYSDSAKDAGRLAASWAQYNAQEAMVNIANEHKVEVTFFHGKGGTVGRGANPKLYQAILAHPPNTINGRFRVTEQGEMITQNFGQDAIAERTLDLFTAGVLVEKFVKRPEPKKEWREMMAKLSERSCEEYRKVVRGEPRFVPYFRAATPEQELAGLNVGSRPAKRNPKGGVESLRAIPWVFAWTQTRLNLPTWLGVGEALEEEYAKNPKILLEMYKEWPWFQTVLDLVEMILAKSEERIARNYDVQLVTDPESVALGNELRQKLLRTSETILKISGNKNLQQNNTFLLRSMDVRNPYVDPLNIIQAELLKRLRDPSVENLSSEDQKVLQDSLLCTINGIANGLRNSG